MIFVASGARPRDVRHNADVADRTAQLRQTIGTHGRAVAGQTNTFSAANSAFGSYWA